MSNYEYVVQGNYGYGHGWEDECVETSLKEGKDRLREYQEDCQLGAHRLVRRLEGKGRGYEVSMTGR